MPEQTKSCRTCKYFRYGKCTLASELFTFEYPDKLDVGISNGELTETLREVLDGEVKPDVIIGSDTVLDRKEFIINRIIRAIRELENETLGDMEVNVRDCSNFYCAKYE